MASELAVAGSPPPLPETDGSRGSCPDPRPRSSSAPPRRRAAVIRRHDCRSSSLLARGHEDDGQELLAPLVGPVVAQSYQDQHHLSLAACSSAPWAASTDNRQGPGASSPASLLHQRAEANGEQLPRSYALLGRPLLRPISVFSNYVNLSIFFQLTCFTV